MQNKVDNRRWKLSGVDERSLENEKILKNLQNVLLPPFYPFVGAIISQ